MNLGEKLEKIFRSVNDSDVDMIYKHAIYSMSIVKTRSDAEEAVIFISPFFIRNIYDKLNNENKKELLEKVHKLESEWEGLENLIITLKHLVYNYAEK